MARLPNVATYIIYIYINILCNYLNLIEAPPASKRLEPLSHRSSRVIVETQGEAWSKQLCCEVKNMGSKNSRNGSNVR